MFASGPASGTQIFRVEERERELGPYLFRWDKPDESAADLEKALHELKYHQLAFLSGFRASVKEGTRELLKTLDPQAIEAELTQKTVSVAGLKIPFKFAPFKHKLLWREYRRRVDELLHLEDQQLEGKFRPHFRQGYVGFMAAKPVLKEEENA
jgi:predicted component of type VI protein secretion system